MDPKQETAVCEYRAAAVARERNRISVHKVAFTSSKMAGHPAPKAQFTSSYDVDRVAYGHFVATHYLTIIYGAARNRVEANYCHIIANIFGNHASTSIEVRAPEVALGVEISIPDYLTVSECSEKHIYAIASIGDVGIRSY